MNKPDLIEQLAVRTTLSGRQADSVINTIFDAMTDALMNEERVEIRGFGSFHMKHYPSYKGRNPSTGESIEVHEKRLPVFRAGKELKARLRRGDERE